MHAIRKIYKYPNYSNCLEFIHYLTCVHKKYQVSLNNKNSSALSLLVVICHKASLLNYDQLVIFSSLLSMSLE